MDCIDLNHPLTLGDLRELVNNGQLSKFPDNTQINMCINKRKKNVMCDTGDSLAPVLSIIGDEDEITFYNYI